MFKNVIPFQFKPDENDFSSIPSQLIKEKKLLFKELDDESTCSRGFSLICDDLYFIESGNRILLKVTFATKKINKKTVELLLNKRIEKIKKEKDVEDISDDVISIYREKIEKECLMYSNVTYKNSHILIDKNSSLIFVEASSSNLAEDSLHLVRQLIGTLKIKAIDSTNVSILLSDILNGHISNKFLPTNINIPMWAQLKAEDRDGTTISSISTKGIDRSEQSFLKLLESNCLQIKNIEIELIKEKTVQCKLVLFFAKNKFIQFKNFCYSDEGVSANSSMNDRSESDDGSLYYASEMLIIGSYLSEITQSLTIFTL